MYAALLFFCAAIQAIVLNASINGVQLTAVRIRTILLGAIYKKSLRLSKNSRSSKLMFNELTMMEDCSEVV